MYSFNKLVSLASAVLLTSVTLSAPIFACAAHHPKGGNAKSTTSSSATTAIAAADNSTSQAKYRISAKDSLMTVRELVHRIQSVSTLVINDIEQRDMVVTGEPMLMHPLALSDDNKPEGWAKHMTDLGQAEPPKKKWMDKDVAHLGDLVADLEQEIASSMTATQGNAEDNGSWQQIQSIAKQVETHYNSLVSLTKGPTYDNIAIGKEALWIYSNTKDLEAPWKSLAVKKSVK